MSQETSPGGSTIYRYQDPSDPSPQISGVYAREIQAHFDQAFPDRQHFAIHVPDASPIDVHILPPKDKDGYYVLYTTGMSDLPMTLPPDIDEPEKWQYAELYMFLPPTWQFGLPEDDRLSNKRSKGQFPPQYHWPVTLLRFLGQFPHAYKTWLGWGHTMPNGPSYAPICEGTTMGGVVLDIIRGVPPMETRDGKRVNFFFVIPAYKEEIEYKLKYGMKALTDRFAEGDLPLVVDIRRPNLCPDFKEVLDG